MSAIDFSPLWDSEYETESESGSGWNSEYESDSESESDWDFDAFEFFFVETNISRAYEVLVTKIAVAKQWAANRAKELGSYLEEWQSRGREEACPLLWRVREDFRAERVRRDLESINRCSRDIEGYFDEMKELSHRKEGLAENIEKWNMLLSLVEEVDVRKEEILETIQAIRAGA